MIDAALREQIGSYKKSILFTDDLKGNALLAVLDVIRQSRKVEVDAEW